jgi:UDP-N-acetylglucosamine--N-acetylmuramyl-(pentapeptide) pyrophosphoryl-undecaprenol N-acetylglucosamine transferase
MNSAATKPLVAIACGGTGGHLFPGLAVAEQLTQRGCEVTLLLSPKEIDRQAAKSAQGVAVFTLPAVGLQNRNYASFAVSFCKSFLAARQRFKRRPPAAVLAMGGFTSAPPVLAGKKIGAKTFLHESNTVPGKANRFLARFVDLAFIGFPEAGTRLRARRSEVTGTPVRPQFSPVAGRPRAATECRQALGLDPESLTVLVVGGSQGAHGLNTMMLSALPRLKGRPWQWLHLTGAKDFASVQAAYAAHGMRAVVKPFFAEMELALGAATVCVSRAGASSLAELAAMRLPSLLVPLPTAADNHQFCNAAAFEKTGAARILEQRKATPETTAAGLAALVEDHSVRDQMQSALAQWHAPQSAALIAGHILSALEQGAASVVEVPHRGNPSNPAKLKATV